MKQKKFSYAKWGYIFALPFCITYLVCMIYPVIYTMVIGFTNMEGLFHDKIGLPTTTVENEANREVVEHFLGFRDALDNPDLAEGDGTKQVVEQYLSFKGVLETPSLIESVKDEQIKEQLVSLNNALSAPNYNGAVIEHFLNFRSALKDPSFVEGIENEKITEQYVYLKDFIDDPRYNEEMLHLFFDFIDVVKTPEFAAKAETNGTAELYMAFADAVNDPDVDRKVIEDYLNFAKLVKNPTFIKSVQYKEVKDPFKNFKNILKDPLFSQSMKNTLIIWIVNFIPQIVLAFILAAWFTNARMKLRGKGFFKVVFYMPNIITAATIAMLFTSLFAYPTGAVNDLLVRLEILEKPWEFPMSDLASKLVVAFIQFWMWYGYTMIVLISGILGISPELFEAADIDGANGVQKFFRITLPNLKQIILFTLVTSMIGGLQMFDIPNMYNAATGNRRAIRTVSVLIQEKSFGNAYLYNQGAAISMFMFAIVGVLAGIIFFVMRDKDEIKQHKIEKAQIKAFKKQMLEEKMKEAGK